MDFIFRWEGGYVNDPADPGGETKYGISKNANPGVDIKNLTKEDAKRIYHDKYWLGSGAHMFKWPECLMIMDTAVLHGLGAAQKWMKEYGPIIVAWENKRRYVYSVSANSERYGRAWNRRLDELMKEAGFETE
jgi:lysozyme family protein